jgi:hypothetical protein
VIRTLLQTTLLPLFNIALAVALVAPGVLAAEIVPPEKALPGVERGSWSLEPWGNSGAAERTPGEGRARMLKLICEGGAKDKTAFKHLTYFGVSRTGKIRFNVYAPQEKPPAFAVALCTTVAYHWHESKMLTLKTGWNALELPVDERVWKTEQSKWEHTARVEPQEEIRAVDLLVYNGRESAVLFVYGFQYDPDAQGERLSAVTKQMLSEDPFEREEAEKIMVGIGRPATEALIQLADHERPEVMLRAASALRELDKIAEPEPPDPKVREEMYTQRETQRFDEVRRRADYALNGLNTQRTRLLGLMQDAQKEMLAARDELQHMTRVDEQKRTELNETLAKIEKTLKELEGVLPPMLQTTEKK